MSYSVLTITPFDSKFKRLAKKYPSLKSEIVQLASDLSLNPLLGTPLGNNCFKIRLSIASKGKGKRGGARIITCVKVIQETVFLLSIFDKSEEETISETELIQLISHIQ